MARLVEVAALTLALKRMGHDSAKDFNDRLIAFMTAGRGDQITITKPIEREEHGPTDDRLFFLPKRCRWKRLGACRTYQ